MAAEASRAPSVREQKTAPGAFHRFIAAVEPWYDWGRTYISHIDTGDEGPGRFVEVQWLGFNLTIFVGRTPKAVR
jgi:hypothetical protein